MSGKISVELHGTRAVFAELSSTYPLKLLSPRVHRVALAVAYICSYGGGLVSGDRISLSVDVASGTTLVLLSQGSTKVFKFRPGQHASTGPSRLTTQCLDFAVAGSLFLLPDPVTCFRDASYNQIQTFRLASRDASLVALDWVTSGRKSRGEEWMFSRYYSVNEVIVEGKRVAKDVMLLEDASTLAEKLGPYSCYATLILYGPRVQGVIRSLKEEYGRISVFKATAPSELLWSLSEIGGGGVIVRVAGDTEKVRNWLGAALDSLEDVVATRAFA
ncbi:UreD urease accessory protein-domain-containing protein [Roridomyces roridus]|uniref:UreD urease accessory protein-domain-containing protein n=1 Tax=Roridomyces roridus TaxID=1738132 RepID=A0AAD7BU38_9AGAR|nr:UreD urease accessory protein-domain-containing protein [Roridomyces roridus]